MNNAFSYLRAQLLRARKYLLRVLAFCLALTAVVSVIFLHLMEQDSAKASRKKISIGIVGDLTDSYLNIGLFTLENFDSSRFYLEFAPMTEEEARTQLRTAQITGYLRIPDGFVEDALKMEDVQVEYVAGNSPSTLGPTLVQEIADVVSQIVTAAQGGVYGFLSLPEAKALDRKVRQSLVDKLSLEYVDAILAREGIYSVEYLGVAEGLGLAEYYLCSFFLLVLLLCGLPCAPLLVHSDLALPRLLYSRGEKSWRQVLAEFVPFFCILACCCMLLFGVQGCLAEWTEVSLFASAQNLYESLLLGLKMLPAVLLLAAMQFLLYELTSSLVSAVLLQVLVTVILTYLSGLFLPLYSLPPILQTVTPLLPVGMAFSYAAQCVTSAANPALPLVCTALLLLASALLRSVKLRRASYDG